MEKFQFLKKTELNQLPRAPGVYALSSPKQTLYIGKALNIRDRVKNHFAQPTYRDNLFVKQVSRVGYIKADSDVDALILESQLIKEHQPKYNVLWKDDKKYFFVAFSKEKFPRVFLTHQPVAHPMKGQDKAEYVGPFTQGRAIKKVLRLLRGVFPYYTAKKHSQLPCQWCYLGLCPGPTPEAASYKKTIASIKAVLKGKRNSVQKRLQRDMEKASLVRDFERAAELRDQFLALERIVSHARLFAPTQEGKLSSWNILEKDLRNLLKTQKRIARLEAYDISNIQGKEATGSQVTFVKGVPAKEWYRKYKIRWPGGVSRLAVPPAHRSQRNSPREAKQLASRPNDFAMMQELITRRLAHLEWPYPDLMVVDGGKGQLSAALKAIESLTRLKEKKSLHRIKVVALAKREEELFFPGKGKPVPLRDLPRPLENLFLHIRDEAHRFAVTYHRLLHGKQVIGE